MVLCQSNPTALNGILPRKTADIQVGASLSQKMTQGLLHFGKDALFALRSPLDEMDALIGEGVCFAPTPDVTTINMATWEVTMRDAKVGVHLIHQYLTINATMSTETHIILLGNKGNVSIRVCATGTKLFWPFSDYM